MERWQHAIVVGASSGIGAEIAQQAAADGCRVALLARREDELRRLADEINEQAGEQRAVFFAHDVTQYDEVPALFQEVCRSLGGLDAIIYSAGVMPRVAPDEYAFANDRAVVEVNLLGAIAWLNEAAHRFTQARAGVICAISSVAGDRGRSGSPVYCASKAGLDTYLEALRNRLGRFGVAVVTVKPGPVDTPMTRGLDRLPMLTAPKTAARLILDAAHRRRNVAYIPRQWRPIMWIIRSIPSWLFQRMKV